ncbi:VWA domain-containing protein [Ornithinibacillus sp. FSL M8-0202]|uniref:vWA domain-containing protein n=1 Tax=unclassified Ornithinibacillus TaxID=2620869 RepID=UPI0030CD9271
MLQNKYRKIVLTILVFSLVILIQACSEQKNEEVKTEVENDNNKKVEKEKLDTQKERDEDRNDLVEEPTNNLSDIIEIAPEEPTNLEEIINYPTGPLAGNGSQSGKEPRLTDREMADKVKELLPPIQENVDEVYLDKWWRAYRYLFAEDYEDPNQIITKMKFDNFGHPGLEDEQFQFKDQINVLVVLDVSGSMANEINGKSMMDIAKDSIREFTSSLPNEANVGLRVYGHEGARTGKTPEQSCEVSELVYEIQPINATEFNSVIDPFIPTGWTPIGLSLEQAKEDFANFPGETNTNLVYIVSDGAETCGGDPAGAAKELAESNIQSIVNVIGFNVDIEGQSHLREIAEAGGGIYANAGDEDQLNEAFDQARKIIEMWDEWKRGVKKDVFDQRVEQRVDIMNYSNNWWAKNFDEEDALRQVLFILSQDEFITKEAGEYVHQKRTERFTLYNEIRETSYKDWMEEIENNYNEVQEQIDEFYQDNVGD